MGTTTGEFDGFEWAGATVDWDKQEYYKDLVFQDFTLPITDYVRKRGYFGLVTFELLITDQGKYLVDLNPRVGGDTTHLLLARHMATEFDLKRSAMFTENKHKFTAQELVSKVNDFNHSNKNQGMAVILSAVNGNNNSSESEISVFAKTSQEVQALFQKLVN